MPNIAQTSAETSSVELKSRASERNLTSGRQTAKKTVTQLVDVYSQMRV